MKILKKTKIVATIGPATSTQPMLEKMLRSGVNVARLNFSHGDHEEHAERIQNIRKASEKTKVPVSILQDLGGPKIRTGDFYQEHVTVKRGDSYTFTTKKVLGDESICYINYPSLPQEVRKGNIILLDDGKKSFKVLSTTKDKIHCRIIVGGTMKHRRGVNIPGVDLKKIKAFTSKDKNDLLFGIQQGVDYVGLSFVRYPSEITELKNFLKRRKCEAKVIAKIETTQAIDNLQDIIRETDGIMVARGDLAVEIPAQDVPLIQKDIIATCRQLGKPVIVATQMLASMVDSPRPSRAEVSDVANSILDGTDAVMLSEETAIGQYPLEAIRTMTSIAQKIESHISYRKETKEIEQKETVDSVSYSIVKTAHEVGAKAIVALTEAGLTARMIARHKPEQPILSLTPNLDALHRLPLNYGCYPFHITHVNEINKTIKLTNKLLLEEKLAKRGDVIVIAAGIPFGHKGGTNMLLVQTVK